MTMREKIAQALRTELRNQGVLWEDDPLDASKLMMQTCAVADMTGVVSAVLAAMRKPSAWMVDEGCAGWLRPYSGTDDPRKFGDKIIDVWGRMIAAASVDDHGNPETQAMIDTAIAEQ